MQSALKPVDVKNIAEEYRNYAYIVSHDLGAPIRSILEFSRLLQEEMPENLTSDAKLYLEMIMQSSRKMQIMMEGLLAFSRLNTMAQPFAAVDMNVALAESFSVLQPAIAARQAVIETQPLPILQGDRGQLLQLLTALIDNAIKFVPFGRTPQIRISALGQDRSHHFVIEDNGIGIDEKFHDRIFEIFRRLHTDDEYPGMGMGLALVRKIITHHGGAIWIESGILGGSAFHFTLAPQQSDNR